MPPEKSKDPILDLSPDDIKDLYESGYISREDRDVFLHRRSKALIQQGLDKEGFVATSFKKVVEKLNEGWEDFKSIQGEGSNIEKHNALKSLWGQIEIYMALSNGIGEVAREDVERRAMSYGAPPGLAYSLGLATEFVVNMGPVGMASKAFAKAVKGPAEAATKAGAKAAAQKAEDEKADLLKMAGKILEQGAEREGVKIQRPAGEAVEQMKTLAKAPDVPRRQQEIFDEASKVAKRTLDKDARNEINAIAKKYHLNLNELYQSTGYTTKQMHAYLTVLDPNVSELKTLAQRALAPNATDIELTGFAHRVTELFTMNPREGARKFSGKEMQDLLMHWDPENAAKGDYTAAMRTLAEDVAGMESKNLFYNVMRNQQGFMTTGENWWGHMREGFINSLLPFAAIPSFLGNSMTTGIMLGERMAGTFGTKNWREPFYMMKGLAMAQADGIGGFRDAYKYVVDPKTGKMVHAVGSATGRLDYEPVIQGPLGRFVRLPGDTVRGVDMYHSALLYRAGLYSAALREANDNPAAVAAAGGMKQFVENAVMNPSTTAMREARDLASSGTYQDQLGGFGRGFQQVAQWGPGVLYFPFVKTPVNLIKFTWNHTPGLQLISHSLYRDIAKGGAAADAAVGRLTMANMQAIMLYEMAKDGLITGGGPRDPAMRKSWEATHKPYSIKTPWGWMPYNTGLEPFSQMMGIVADYNEIRAYLKPEEAEEGAYAMVLTIAGALGPNLANNSWFRMGGELFDAVNGVRTGEGWGYSTVSALTAPLKATGLPAPVAPLVPGGPMPYPGGPLATRGKAVVDPLPREARTIVDKWRAQTPGWSETLPPVRDGWGDPIIPGKPLGGWWGALFRPLVPSFAPGTEDAVKTWGARLEVELPYFPWSIGAGKTPNTLDLQSAQDPDAKLPIDIDAQTRDRRIQLYRNMIYHKDNGLEATVLNSEEFAKANRALKREMYMDFVQGAYKNSGNLLLLERPDLAERLLNQNLKVELEKLDIHEREGIEKATQESIKEFRATAPQELENLTKFGDISLERDPVEITIQNTIRR